MTAIPKAEMHHPRSHNIDYFPVPGTDKPYFRCARLKATLSAPACATMWKAAQMAKGSAAERLETCRRCQVGAEHSGETIVVTSKYYRSSICPRCRRGAGRMIGGALCVSCYNRERELIAGKNARGTAPVKAAKLHSVDLTVVIDGVPKTYRTGRVLDFLEPMIAVLRQTKGSVVFARPGRCALREKVHVG